MRDSLNLIQISLYFIKKLFDFQGFSTFFFFAQIVKNIYYLELTVFLLFTILKVTIRVLNRSSGKKLHFIVLKKSFIK